MCPSSHVEPHLEKGAHGSKTLFENASWNIVQNCSKYSTTTFPVRQENGGAKKLGEARKVILTSLCDLTIQLALVLLAVFCTSVTLKKLINNFLLS